MLKLNGENILEKEREILSYEEELVIEKIIEFANEYKLIQNIKNVVSLKSFSKILERTEDSEKLIEQVDTQLLSRVLLHDGQRRLLNRWQREKKNSLNGNEIVNSAEEDMTFYTKYFLINYGSPRLVIIMLKSIFENNKDILLGGNSYEE